MHNVNVSKPNYQCFQNSKSYYWLVFKYFWPYNVFIDISVVVTEEIYRSNKWLISFVLSDIGLLQTKEETGKRQVHIFFTCKKPEVSGA